MALKDAEAKQAYDKRYYKENRGRIRENQKRYREENRERLLAYDKRRYAENRGAQRAYKLKRQYDLSMEEYTRMLIDQAGLCDICENQMLPPREPHVDHDHTSGFVRALLCHSCNVGLHYVEEHEGFFEKAEQYLEKFPRW